MSGPRPLNDLASAWLSIDLKALAHNYTLLTNRTNPNCQAAGIVKADAYGLGVAQIVSVLEKQNCPFYFVATPDEAFDLRSMTDKPVAVLNGIFPGTEKDYLHHNLTPVLNSLSAIESWQTVAKQNETNLPAIIHCDTGMNRLGLGSDEIEKFFERSSQYKNLTIKLIMSHFACADEQENTMTHTQYERFVKIAKHFPQAQKSLANSAGIFRSPDYHFDMVRPGMALYGLNPTPEINNPMKPIVTLKTRILQLRTAPKGENVGYGATHRIEKNTTLATVALGYADGFLRALGNKGILYYKGSPCPIVGRVSMDLVTVDMGDKTPLENEKLEVIGPHQSADDLAKAAGTIGYEVLTNLGTRYQRRYLS